MNVKLWTIAPIIIGALALTACQTADLSNQTNQTINMPTVVVNLESDGDGVPDIIDNCPNTPEDVVTDEYGCPVAVNLIGYLTMELRVFFERNSSELQTKYLPEVEKVAEKMHSDPDLVVVLSGHTSEPEVAQIAVGIDGKTIQAKADNRLLGRDRAQVIKNVFVNRNVARDKIYIFDCADSMPIAPNDIEEGASMNQRIYGKALKADDFYTENGYEHSLTYYKEFCQQF